MTEVSYGEKITMAKKKLESLRTQNRKSKRILNQMKSTTTLFSENPYNSLNSTELTSILLFRGIIYPKLETREILLDKLAQDDEELQEKRYKNLKQNVTTIQSALRGYEIKRTLTKESIEEYLQTLDSDSLIKKCLFLKSTELNLSGKSLSKIPIELKDCTHVKSLNLSKNIITEIPEWFPQVFIELSSLDLSQNCLEDLPSYFRDLKKLEDLNLSFNQFDFFPTVLEEVSLKKLEISSNMLREIPDGITEISTLEYLDISNNLITKIPEELTSMKKLSTAHIQGNRFDNQSEFKELSKKLTTKRRRRDGWQQRQTYSDVDSPLIRQSSSSNFNDEKSSSLIDVQKSLSTSPNSPHSGSLQKKKKGFQIKGILNRDSFGGDLTGSMSNLPAPSTVDIGDATTPLVTEDERKEMNERSRLILEIVESERKYVEFLKGLLEQYVFPLQQGTVQRKGKLLIPLSQAQYLFPPDLSSLVHFNSALLKSLEECYKNTQGDARSIAETFIRMAPMLKLYVSYTSSYQKYVDEIRTLMKEKPDFAAWAKDVAKIVGDKLLSLLMMPIQRMPRYRMLFESLKKMTEPGNMEYDMIIQALELIMKNADTQNEMIRFVEKQERMKEILSELKLDDLFQPHRLFIKEGKAGKNDDIYSLYLFNDILLLRSENDENEINDLQNTFILDADKDVKNYELKIRIGRREKGIRSKMIG
eukprot:gene7418-11741_t